MEKRKERVAHRQRLHDEGRLYEFLRTEQGEIERQRGGHLVDRPE